MNQKANPTQTMTHGTPQTLEDFEAFDRRINASRDEFLAARARYDEIAKPYIKQIDNTFLSILSENRDGKYSSIAVENADETRRLLHTFNISETNLLSQVGFLGIWMQQVTLALQIKTIEVSMNAIATKDASETMKRLNSMVDTRAAEITEAVERMNMLATGVISQRHKTLAAFRGEHLELPMSEYIARAAEELQRQLQDKALELLDEALAEMAKELIKVTVPVTSIIFFVAHVLGPKEIDLSKGGPDIMQELLVQFRKENEILRGVEAGFQKAIEAFEVMGKEIQRFS